MPDPHHLPPLESAEGLAAYFAGVDLTGLPAEQAEALGDLIGDLLLQAQERGYQAAIDELRGVVSRTGSPTAAWAAGHLDGVRRMALTPGGAGPASDTRRAVVRLHALLAEILSRFTEKGHPGEPCVRTGWVAESTVASWYQRFREAEHA